MTEPKKSPTSPDRPKETPGEMGLRHGRERSFFAPDERWSAKELQRYRDAYLEGIRARPPESDHD